MPIPYLKTPKHPVPDDEPASQPRSPKARWIQKLLSSGNGAVRILGKTLSTIMRITLRLTKRLREKLRKPNKRRLVRFWLPVSGIALLVIILSGIVTFAWFARDLPDPDRISDRSVAQSTRIFARDGTTLLYEIHGDEKRTIVELADISKFVIDGTIAIEDKDFYKHRGFSVTGIIRSAWRDITTGSRVGGSTITQQFVKNAILTTEKKLTRKIREVVLAYEIERRFTKEQILKLYFNEIPYGSNAYGVEAAAQMYFGKRAKDLSLAESSILAAIPQAPTFYSPYGNNSDALLKRAHLVLDRMAEQGYISQAQADEAKSEDVLANVKPKRETIIAPHFVFYVKQLLTEKYGELAVERDGLKVITSLDVDKQRFAEEAVAEQEGKNAVQHDAHNAALVAIDPKTGQVLAMVGSRDYFNPDIDGNVNVALTLQQPGSSIKPIVYATAFDRGYTPDTMLFDLETRFKIPGAPDYVPHNYDGSERGPLTMRQALAGSLNIPAVKTLYLAGVDNVVAQAQKLGYSTWNDRSRLGLSLVLGGADVTLVDHTAAFGAIANDGRLHRTTPILRVEDKSGKTLEEFKDQSTDALSQQASRLVTSVMSDNDARSFVFGSRSKLILPGRPVAAKTGTTQEFRDGWTMGFTPSLAAGVWVGNNENRPMRAGSDGVVVAAPIWNSFMRKALEGTKVEAFPSPKPIKTDKPILNGKLEGEEEISVDAVTGRVIPDSCLDEWPDQFVKKVTVKSVHTILYYLDKNKPQGPPPTDPTKDIQFASWEAPIREWAKKNNYVEEKPKSESCSLRSSVPSVTITAPIENATVNEALKVTLEVDSRRPIESIEYAIDDAVLKTLGAEGTSTTLDLSSVDNGYHTLTVTVIDNIENTTSTSTTINVLKSGTQSSLYFTSPDPGTRVSASDSLRITVYAFDASGVDEVSFTAVSPSGSKIELGTAAVNSSSLASIDWTIPVKPGNYKISATAKTRSGNSLTTDSLTVTVDL